MNTLGFLSSAGVAVEPGTYTIDNTKRRLSPSGGNGLDFVSESDGTAVNVKIQPDEPGKRIRISHSIVNNGKTTATLGEYTILHITVSARNAFAARLFLDSGNTSPTCVAMAGEPAPYQQTSMPVPPPDEPLTHMSMDHMLAFDPETPIAVHAYALTFNTDTPFMSCAAPEPSDNKLTIDVRGDYRSYSLAPGERLMGDTYMLAIDPDPFALLEGMARQLAGANGVSLPPRPVSGWCSWYFHGKEIDSQKIINAARNYAKRIGVTDKPILLIDHGWQDDKGTLGNNHRCDADLFPKGMDNLATELKKLGFKPAIWVSPLRYNEHSEFFQTQREAFLKLPDDSGPLPYGPDSKTLSKAGYSYFLDATHPETRREIESVVNTCIDWGYEYIKCDFADIPDHIAYMHSDRSLPANAPVNRKIFEPIMKTAAEHGTRILACISFNSRLAGLAHDQRIGRDTNPGKPRDRVREMATTIASSYFYNGITWHNDADCLCTSGPASENGTPAVSEGESRLRTMSVFLSGGTCLLGDNPETVPEDRLDLYRRCLPLYGKAARPLDLFETIGPPHIHLLPVTDLNDQRCVMGLTNYNDDEIKYDLSHTQTRIEPPFTVIELFTGERIAVETDSFPWKVPGWDARLLLIVKHPPHPWLIGIDSHWTGGFSGILPHLEWNKNTLSFNIKNVSQKKDVKVHLHIPDGYAVESVDCDNTVAETKESMCVLGSCPGECNVRIAFAGPA